MNCYKYCCLSLIGMSLLVPSAIAVPSPESLSTPQKLELRTKSPVYLSRNNRTREYIYKAPDNKTLSNTNLTAVSGYKVEVYGSEKELLLEVRNVEPKAFIKGDLIQVGIFSQQNNAQDMVRKLVAKGFWARIITQ